MNDSGSGGIQCSISSGPLLMALLIGSVRQLTDHTGAVTLAQSYAPYGDVLSHAGSGVSVHQFAGEMRDVTGLTFLRARYLDSGVGRFISRDTWGGDYLRPLSLNRWNFVEGNPVNLTDPSGYDPHWCGNDVDCWLDYLTTLRDILLRCNESDTSISTTASVIFVCGHGVGNCETGTYSDKPIFGDVVSWANSNNYQKHFFQSDMYEKEAAADDILTRLITIVEMNPDATIFLLGHSAGADSAVDAVYEYLHDEGGNAGSIGGIALLDSYLNIGGDIEYEGNYVDDRIAMWGGQSRNEIKDNDFGERLNGELGLEYYTIGHLELAVDPEAQFAIIAYFESRR